jgi:hypothetical protein
MEPVTLYRVMCDVEFFQLIASRRFMPATGSVEAKYFAETLEDAAEWGKWFQRQSGIVHDRIVAVRLSRVLVDRMWRFPMLDGIGPAVFATSEQLSEPAELEVVR